MKNCFKDWGQSSQATECVVKYIFLISHIKHMLWVVKSTVLLAPQYVLTNGVVNNHNYAPLTRVCTVCAHKSIFSERNTFFYIITCDPSLYIKWIILTILHVYWSLHRHVVYNVPVCSKANRGDRNQLGVWLDSDLIAE